MNTSRTAGPTRSSLASYPPEEPLVCGPTPPADRSGGSPPTKGTTKIERVASNLSARMLQKRAETPEQTLQSIQPREKNSCEPEEGGGLSPRPPKGDPWKSPTLGSGVQSGWDAVQRAEYKRLIAEQATRRVAQIDALQRGAALALRENRPQDAAVLLDEARQIAQEANAERNRIRSAIQQRMSPAGRASSKAMEADRSWATLVQKYGKDHKGFELYRTIAQKSGTSSPGATQFAAVGGVLAAGAVVKGVVDATQEVQAAPPEKKPGVVIQQGVQMAGSAVGANLGAMAARGALLALGVGTGGGSLAVGAAIAGVSALGGWVGGVLARELVPGKEEP